MHGQTTEHVEVLITEPGQLDELLNKAEAALRQTARCHQAAGIIVTRHDHTRYTMALSGEVPFGETHELALT